MMTTSCDLFTINARTVDEKARLLFESDLILNIVTDEMLLDNKKQRQTNAYTQGVANIIGNNHRTVFITIILHNFALSCSAETSRQ